MAKLLFSMIKNGPIFESDFQNLTPENGTIEFRQSNGSSQGGIAVVYAPNGTGKSSIARLLESKESANNLSFSAIDESNKAINPELDAFHVIHDQVGRNVIQGEERDYLIGRQIRREYELIESIKTTIDKAYIALNGIYKSKYKVSKVGDYLLSQLEKRHGDDNEKACSFIRSIVNTKFKGKDILYENFVSFVRNIDNKPSASTLDTEKKDWLIADLGGAHRITEKLIKIDFNEIVANEETKQIERHDDAIGILEKYHSSKACIVCDNTDFNGDDLLNSKKANRKRIYEGLNQLSKDLIDNVLKNDNLFVSDPFEIRRIVGRLISEGDEIEFRQLQKDLLSYITQIENDMISELFHCFDDTHLFQEYDEYSRLISNSPQFDDEELLYIQDVINESIGKDLTIEREPKTKRLKLKLGDKDLLGTDRENMELSSGEQNFISLAFELLLARHSSKRYVVLDDPISSFDSIYKNKIAYCIIKFLECKLQIVLTHNIDLIRLLNVQRSNSFNLYILNNTSDGQNGFILVSDEEKKLVINLHELIKFFQNKNNSLDSIRNRRLFLMSMIPFLRGYAHINLDSKDYYSSLSRIMHGYEEGNLDLVPIYNDLFGLFFDEEEIVSVSDILCVDCSNLDIIDRTKYPLLSETLELSLICFHLRMKVERELVDLFHIEAGEMDTLNQIINKALNCSQDDPLFEQKRKYRVYFTSRKTLLNEFNHFEGNMSLFQPAIDINKDTLRKEIEGIKTKLTEMKEIFI